MPEIQRNCNAEHRTITTKFMAKTKSYAAIPLGVLMMSFAISVFYTPNKIVSGGASGVSTILHYVFGIQPGSCVAPINMVLPVLSMKYLGTNFVKNTI